MRYCDSNGEPLEEYNDWLNRMHDEYAPGPEDDDDSGRVTTTEADPELAEAITSWICAQADHDRAVQRLLQAAERLAS